MTTLAVILIVAAQAPSLPASLQGTGPPASGRENSCAYVTSFGGEDVCGFRIPDGQSLGCARSGAKPHGLALSPDGSRL